MQERKIWKAVVCGTGFGMFYIEAIKHLPEEFELVGIVATGLFCRKINLRKRQNKSHARYHGESKR